MPITKEALQECVDKLLLNEFVRVDQSSVYPDCLVAHIEVKAAAYLDANRESLSHMPDRMIAALEQIKVLVDHSIATIRENS
jgi:Sec7-like guanine-nucleotide exchange factor